MSELQEPVYDDRVNATLDGLSKGKSLEELSQEFGLSTPKSLAAYLRRRGFYYDKEEKTYIPKTEKQKREKKVTEKLDFDVPTKAKKVIDRLDRGDDPREVAGDLGFSDHRDLAEYMKEMGLSWDSDRQSYVKDCEVAASKEEVIPTDNVVEMSTKTSASSTEASTGSEGGSSNLANVDGFDRDLSRYLPLLELLEHHKEELLALLSPASSGNIPRYPVPGEPKTKSIYMSDLLAGLISEFSEEKNLSQRVIVEGALIEYLKKYGYADEVERLLNRS